ncbi:MAG: right-handed parallel beta-helix repeat-containing protein, partial [Thermoleophilia bacterium]|nr:right-handed parallel beta-helix repeat-containing protein [Thermoleophilia bacterium]
MYLTIGFLLLAVALAAFALASPASAAQSVFNVRDFGAKGDGLTDDTLAIQAAIDQAAAAGGSVYIPSGTYVVSKQGSNAWALRLASGITVFGDGPSSLIKLAPNQDFWTRVLSGTDIADVVLRDFAIDGNDNNQAIWSEQRHGVFISRGQNITSQRLLVRNTSGDGIFYYGGSSGLIEGCTVVGGAVPKNARVGINFQGAAGLVVRNNTVTNYDTSFKAE